MHRLTSGTLRDAFPAAWGGQNNFSELEKLFFDVGGLGEAKRNFSELDKVVF